MQEKTSVQISGVTIGISHQRRKKMIDRCGEKGGKEKTRVQISGVTKAFLIYEGRK